MRNNMMSTGVSQKPLMIASWVSLVGRAGNEEEAKKR